MTRSRSGYPLEAAAGPAENGKSASPLERGYGRQGVKALAARKSFIDGIEWRPKIFARVMSQNSDRSGILGAS